MAWGRGRGRASGGRRRLRDRGAGVVVVSEVLTNHKEPASVILSLDLSGMPL